MYQIPEGIVYCDNLEVKLFDGRDHKVLFTVPDRTMEFMMVGRAAIAQNYYEVHHTPNVLRRGLLLDETQENDLIIRLHDRFVQMKMFVTRISFDGLVWTDHPFSKFGLHGPYQYGKYACLWNYDGGRYSSDGVVWKDMPAGSLLYIDDDVFVYANIGKKLCIHDTQTGNLLRDIDIGSPRPYVVVPYRGGLVGFEYSYICLIHPDGSWKKEPLCLPVITSVASSEDSVFVQENDTIYMMTEFNVFVPLCSGKRLYQTDDFIIADPFQIVFSKRWSYRRHQKGLPYVRLFVRMLFLSFRRWNLSLPLFLGVMNMRN
jgi:hypothetical protein